MLLFNRRFVLFLLLDTVVLLGLIGVFAAVNHAFVPPQTGLSERILITPEPSGTPDSSPASAIIPETIHAETAAEKTENIAETSPTASLALKPPPPITSKPPPPTPTIHAPTPTLPPP